MSFRYLRPDEMMTANATVTVNSSTLDTAYTAGWLCDLRVGFPVRGASTGLDLTVVGTTKTVDFVAATHLRLDDAVNITLSAGLTATLDGGDTPPNGIPINRYKVIAPASSSGCRFVITGNSVAPIVGEFWAGASRTLPRELRLGAQHSMQRHNLSADAEFASILPYNKGLDGEVLTGNQVYSASEFLHIQDWYRSCRDGSLPTVIVTCDGVCRVVFFTDLTFEEMALEHYRVFFTFTELPRTGW